MTRPDDLALAVLPPAPRPRTARDRLGHVSAVLARPHPARSAAARRRDLAAGVVGGGASAPDHRGILRRDAADPPPRRRTAWGRLGASASTAGRRTGAARGGARRPRDSCAR